MSDHEQHRRDLGSYVLGALDPGERTLLEEHLASCAACRDELASLAGIPGLLSRVTVEEALTDSLLPGPSSLPHLLDAVRRERRADQERLRRWRVGAGVVAAAAAASVGLAVAPLTGADDPTGERLVAAAGSAATGEVALLARQWGTSVELDLDELPPAASYVAWIVDDDGRRTVVATWGPTDDGSTRCAGASSLAPEDVRSVTVETDAGDRLLTLET